MKIGYIVLCHKQPELVRECVNSITFGTENIAVIHVDNKCDSSPFEDVLKDNKQAIFLKNRTSIYWGGFSSVTATVAALKVALEHQCERYVLLQGADYPLHSNEYIDSFFKKNEETEFIKAYNITNSNKKINYMKCWGCHFYDGVDRSEKSLKTLIARAITGFNKLGIKYRRGYYLNTETDERRDIYWGWGHFALTKKCVEYIISEYECNREFNNYFRYVFPADETYFHTLVYNSPFMKKTIDGEPVDESTHSDVASMLNLTYFEYPIHVTVFNSITQISIEILEKFLFVRKVNMEFIESCKQMRGNENENSNNCGCDRNS